MRDAAVRAGDDVDRVFGVPLRRRLLPTPPKARRRRGKVIRPRLRGTLLRTRPPDGAYQVRELFV